jgi:hypothetical protein
MYSTQERTKISSKHRSQSTKQLKIAAKLDFTKIFVSIKGDSIIGRMGFSVKHYIR